MNTEPHHRRRHDGWTPERQALFLAALEDTGCVAAAAAAAGKSRAGAYRFRDRPGGARFGRLWEAALRNRSERLLLEQVAKLTVGVERGRAARAISRSSRPRQGHESDSSAATAEQRQFRQERRLSPERVAELRAIMAAGCRTPSQGRL